MMRKGVIASCIIGLSIVLDQATKRAAEIYLAASPTLTYLGDLFRFQYAENTGVFLGWGSRLPESLRFWGFVVIVGGVLIGITVYVLFARHHNVWTHLGGSVLAGGGFSNLLDRIFNDGAVIDFMNMGIGSLRTGIFNVADMLILTGTGLLLAGQYIAGDQSREKTTGD